MSGHDGSFPSGELAEAVRALSAATGVVIPIYLPTGTETDFARAVIRETVAAFCREVEDPAAVCLCVDGTGPAADIGNDLARERGVGLTVSERNMGKLHATRLGMRRLLKNEAFRYLAVVDQDGDHFANELLNFVRAARHVEQAVGTDRVMALGRRISRCRPMGFLRGELEELADRMLLDALYYDAAATATPLKFEFATTLDEFPDFHSGYKLFTRATGEEVFLTEPQFAGCSEEAYYRHAVEAVISVQALKAGAHLVQVNRSTFDEQPMSAFAQLNRRRMIADKIVWPCKRLAVPGRFVAQWMRNHLPRLVLGTLAPDGEEELLEIRRLVLRAFGLPPEAADEAIVRPRFI